MVFGYLWVKEEGQLLGDEAVSLADLQGYLPSGVIVLWSGTIASIPAGWALCNGTLGTPDLRDRFIVGARQDNAGVANTNITGALTQSGGSINYTPAGTNSTTSGGTPAGTVAAIAATGDAATTVDNDLAASTVGVAAQTHTHPAPAFTGSALAVHGHTFTGTAATIVMPYYTLAYIQKS